MHISHQDLGEQRDSDGEECSVMVTVDLLVTMELTFLFIYFMFLFILWLAVGYKQSRTVVSCTS